ncbi:MAG: hypothetical protein ACK5QT_04490 [Oligoflexia bacterium]|jgi:hypothetical protein
MKRPARKNPTPQDLSRAPELRPEKAELEELISKIKDLVSDSPEKAARILSEWENSQGARRQDPALTQKVIRRKLPR